MYWHLAACGRGVCLCFKHCQLSPLRQRRSRSQENHGRPHWGWNEISFPIWNSHGCLSGFHGSWAERPLCVSGKLWAIPSWNPLHLCESRKRHTIVWWARAATAWYLDMADTVDINPCPAEVWGWTQQPEELSGDTLIIRTQSIFTGWQNKEEPSRNRSSW